MVEKLDELDGWLRRASKEVKALPLKDPRRGTFHEIKQARDKLEEEILQVETVQEEALTRHLESTGPLTLRLQDGSTRVLAAQPRTAGGVADLLPAEFLDIWRVASVFAGSVATPLEFGLVEAREPVKREHRKPVVVTGEISLFEKG